MPRRPPSGTAGLPRLIPVFPLAGVLLLPGGRLPIKLFEPRYLAMVEDSLARGRMFGVIQPLAPEGAAGPPPALFGTGCLGRISAFSETDDGRMLVTLTGLCRFRVAGEVAGARGYREIAADYLPFQGDLEPPAEAAIKRDGLILALRPFAERHGMEVNWKSMALMPDHELIDMLSMACPLEPREKQALLEARSLAERGELLIALMEMAVYQGSARPAISRQ